MAKHPPATNQYRAARDRRVEVAFASLYEEIQSLPVKEQTRMRLAVDEAYSAATRVPGSTSAQIEHLFSE